MDVKRKQDISLVLLCVLCSVTASVFVVSLMFSRPPGGNMEATQIATQTVTINERETPRLVNLNTATAAELMTLPGIGEVLSQRIMDARPFQDVWELADIDGIGGATLRNIIERVTAE